MKYAVTFKNDDGKEQRIVVLEDDLISAIQTALDYMLKSHYYRGFKYPVKAEEIVD